MEGVTLLLGEGREDESGDFTAGAGLGKAQIDQVLGYLASAESGSRADLEPLLAGSDTGVQGHQELDRIGSLLEACGYGPDRIAIHPSVVRGLEYYTGPVYEAELLEKVPNEKGEIVQFGSIGGGGRYDGLVRRFTGQD